MATPEAQPHPPILAPGPEDAQAWAASAARAGELVARFWSEQLERAADADAPAMPAMFDPRAIVAAQTELMNQGLALWERMLALAPGADDAAAPEKDKRFAAPPWRQPPFDALARTYLAATQAALGSVDRLPLDDRARERLRFNLRSILDAMSPANFPWTNPVVIERTLATRGENLAKGMEYLLRDVAKGQLTHTDPDAFEVGRNIAVTPGKVVKETPLYQLVQYSPTTESVREVPVLIFPPWINRFYILDLNEKKSFIRWAVAQGLTVFIVSWKSADESMKDVTQDDYILGGIVDAVDTVRDLLDVPAVNAIGYCVAGTTLAAALAYLPARGEAEKVRSATFFTAQVDFEDAGELQHFIGDEMFGLIGATSGGGVMDGRLMSAAFNALRGPELIWRYVVDHYMLGEDYPAFDLLHWNGDVTHLPAKWHGTYLRDLYRDNLLAKPGGVSVAGTPIDLGKVETPAYVQAGREDHIAPAKSVWKITHHFRGPVRFVLAGSGHIAGVVNPPDAGKYQHWTNDQPVGTLEEFVAGATENKGSWWPDWLRWLEPHAGELVPATGARVPGAGKLPAIEDAPGRYVKER